MVVWAGVRQNPTKFFPIRQEAENGTFHEPGPPSGALTPALSPSEGERESRSLPTIDLESSAATA